jgi:hypothetical protein
MNTIRWAKNLKTTSVNFLEKMVLKKMVEKVATIEKQLGIYELSPIHLENLNHGDIYCLAYCFYCSHSYILFRLRLGTILTPVFMIFFPVDLAIGLTAIVHFVSNIFKLILVGRNANKEVLMRFGIPAIIGAIVGSWLLLNVIDLQPLFSYKAFEKTLKFIR